MAIVLRSLEPNPVVFNYWDVIYDRQLPVTVSWNTENPAVKALLYRSINGAKEEQLPGTASVNGKATPTISLGQEVTFILRNAANKEYLGSDMAITKVDPLAAYLTDPDLDFINALSVAARVDTIGLAFRTKKPAVPYVEIRRQGSGELADSWGP